MATNINCVEQGNNWFRRQVAEELHKVKAHATLPTSLIVLVDVLQTLWPRWMASSGPSDYRKPSTHEDRSRREFLAELRSKGSRIICLNDDSGEDACFAPWAIASAHQTLGEGGCFCLACRTQTVYVVGSFYLDVSNPFHDGTTLLSVLGMGQKRRMLSPGRCSGASRSSASDRPQGSQNIPIEGPWP